MKQLLQAVRHGQPLLHRPIALRLGEQHPVRVVLEVAGRDSATTPTVFPVALKPFTIGVYPGPGTWLDAARGQLRFEDASDSTVLSRIVVEAGQTLTWDDAPIRLVRPVQAAVPCESRVYRKWRHFLAWRHTQAGAVTAQNLQMSYQDLIALNAFYVWPRPVFLVSVAAGERSNMLLMELVAPVGADRFLLALRRTSPSVETMCASRRVVVSGAPAAIKETAYRVGAHHRQASIDWHALPFALMPSTEFGIPRPVESTIVRELHIDDFQEIGSHMLFRCRIVSQTVPGDVPQLCHVSEMYARWRHRQGRAFVDA